ncbi:MAG TPA: thioredoxin family protein [Longilinea sp.]|nr:thioredoxin family protein [Longilinea sp.]
MASIYSKYWANGKNLDEFVSGMETNQAAMLRRTEQTHLTPDQNFAFSQIHSARHLAILTEPWCSDSLMNLPILACIAAAMPQCQLHLYSRSLFPELRTHWEERNYTHIPLCVFLDAEFNEMCIWMERPAAMKPCMDRWMNAHPEVSTVRNDPALSSEQKRERLAPVLLELSVEMESWYADTLQDETVKEVLAVLTV